MSEIVSKPGHGSAIGRLPDGTPVTISFEVQNYFDEIQQKLDNFLLGNQIVLESYTIATLPDVPGNGIIHISDETGGATMAYSNGTNWLRASDGAIAS